MKNIGRTSYLTLVVIAAISVILFISLVANISSNENDPAMGSWINNNLVWAYVLGVIAIAAVILFSIYQMVTNLETAKNGLIGIGFIGAIFLISFLMSSSEYPKFFGVEKFIADGTITPMTTKIIETGLYSTYFFGAIAILSLIYSSISKFFK